MVGTVGKSGLWDMLRPSDFTAHMPSVRSLSTDECGGTQPQPNVRAAAFCPPAHQEPPPNHAHVF